MSPRCPKDVPNMSPKISSHHQSSMTMCRCHFQSNMARVANAVQCHSYLSGNKECHEFRFSIVRIVISVSIVISLQDCFKIFSTIVKIVKKNQNCQNSHGVIFFKKFIQGDFLKFIQCDLKKK